MASHEPEPDCTYDPIEGGSLIPVVAEEPTEKIRSLEAQIGALTGLHSDHLSFSKSVLSS
jgi:hypothetical protein